MRRGELTGLHLPKGSFRFSSWFFQAGESTLSSQCLPRIFRADFGRSIRSQSFRHAPVGPSTPSSSSLPSDPTAAQFFQPHTAKPFDLSPLHRALTPAHSQTPPLQSSAVPAWAQAFQNAPPPAAHSTKEQELFSQAFGRPNPAAQVANGTPAWAQDFSRSQIVQTPSVIQQQQQQQNHQQIQGSSLNTRLYGQGFGMNSGMRMGMGMGIQNYSSPAVMHSQNATQSSMTKEDQGEYLCFEKRVKFED